MDANKEPKCYLSTHTRPDGGEAWDVILSGSPVCRTMRTVAEASKAAEFWGVKPTHVWYGDIGTFRPLREH